jgi:AcrR family transcriptional regulator
VDLTMTSQPIPHGARRGAQTEQELIDVATALFYERGFHGTSMREIAKLVGVGQGAIYYHVANKQELLYRIAKGSISELLAGGRNVLASYETASDRLDAFVRFHVLYHTEHRLRSKVADDQLHALSEEQLAEVMAIRDGYEEILFSILEQGQRELGWRLRDTRITTFAIATMCTAVGVWYREGGRLAPQEIAETYVELVRNATQGGEPAA